MSQPVRVRSVVDEHREQVMGARRRHPSVSPETASALLDAYYAVQKVRSHLDSTVGPLIRRHRSAGFAFGRDAAVRAIRAQMLKLLMIDRPDFSPGLTETAREDQKKHRSWLAQSAHRTGGGVHRNRRDKRQGSKQQRNERAARDGWL